MPIYNNAGEMYRGEVSTEGLIEALKSLIGLPGYQPLTPFSMAENQGKASQALQQPDLGMPATQLLGDMIRSASPAGAQVQSPNSSFDVVRVLQDMVGNSAMQQAPSSGRDPYITGDPAKLKPYIPDAKHTIDKVKPAFVPTYPEVFKYNQEDPWITDRNITSDPTQSPEARAAAHERLQPSIQVRVQKNGNLSFSSANPGVSANTNPSQDQSFSLEGLQKQMQLIASEKDQTAKINLHTQFEQEVAIQKSRILADVQKQAEAELNLPLLRSRLDTARSTDAIVTPGQVSPGTQALASQLNAAEGQVDNRMKMLLSKNSTYGILSAQEAGAKNLLTEGLRQQNKADQLELMDMQKRDIAAARQAQKDEEQIAQAGEQAIQRVRDLGIGFENKTPAEIAMYVNKLKDPTLKTLLTARDDKALPAVAFALRDSKGMGESAQKLLLATEVRNTGRQESDIRKDLASISESLLPKNKQKLLQEAFSGDPKAKELIAAFNSSALSVEERKQQEVMIAGLAIAEVSKKKTAEAIVNAGNWNSTDPAFIKAQAEAKSIIPMPSLKDIYRIYVGDTRGAVRIARGAEFIKSVEQEFAKYQKSAYIQPNMDLIKRELESVDVGPSMLQRANTLVNNAVGNAYDVLTHKPMNFSPRFIGAVGSSLYDAVFAPTDLRK